MANNLLDGDKTIEVARAKKVVECSKGSPECEGDAKVICRVRRDGDAPGVVTLVYNPKDIANELPIRRNSGPRDVGIRNVGPIPCQMCADDTLSNGRTVAMDALLYPAIRDQDDQTFRDNHEGNSKSQYLQQDMIRACIEWMGGSESGITAFYNLVNPNFNSECGTPYVLETAALRIVVTVSMNVYWFTNNCVRQEKTITANRTVSIEPKTFELPTIRGARVSYAGMAGTGVRYGIEYECPKHKAVLMCGTCYYTKDVGGFLQPNCYDPGQARVLASVVNRANQELFDKNGAPTRPFNDAKRIRDSIASEIEAELPAKVNSAALELIGRASTMATGGYIECTPVCGLGYELADRIEVEYRRIGRA